jgi:hypothetical protein
LHEQKKAELERKRRALVMLRTQAKIHTLDNNRTP